MRLVLSAVLVFAFVATAVATDALPVADIIGPGCEQHDPGIVWSGARGVLWDNGPIVNVEPDKSMLQNNTFTHVNYLGWGHQFEHANWVADDFTIPEGDVWSVDTITFFAFQVGSGLTSTITAYHVIIYDGHPSDPGSSIAFGDTTTNVMQSTSWSGVYRVSESYPTSTSYPIMVSVCDVEVTLGPGQYWVAWQADGTLDSGPWVPPVAIWNQPETGDGLQSEDNRATWDYVEDDGLSSFYRQGFPFIIDDGQGSAVERTTWTAIKTLYK